MEFNWCSSLAFKMFCEIETFKPTPRVDSANRPFSLSSYTVVHIKYVTEAGSNLCFTYKPEDLDPNIGLLGVIQS